MTLKLLKKYLKASKKLQKKRDRGSLWAHDKAADKMEGHSRAFDLANKGKGKHITRGWERQKAKKYRKVDKLLEVSEGTHFVDKSKMGKYTKGWKKNVKRGEGIDRAEGRIKAGGTKKYLGVKPTPGKFTDVVQAPDSVLKGRAYLPPEHPWVKEVTKQIRKKKSGKSVLQ